MRNQKKLILEQLDRKLEPLKGAEIIQMPTKGWIHSIRTALNMTLLQLGSRLNITKQGARKLEESESSESITIRSLKEIGNALDMKFVYGFIPKTGSFEKMVEQKSRQLATKIVLRTNQNMLLEDQGNSKDQIELAIHELTLEIKREMRRSIWD